MFGSLIQDRPIRVVVFGGGPMLERGVKQLIRGLEEYQNIDVFGSILPAGKAELSAIAKDLLEHRGLSPVEKAFRLI